MKENVYGYVRVSTREQNVERQLIALEKLGIPNTKIFIDRQSGKDFQRPAYQRMVKNLTAGDVVVTKSIDRLGRNYEEIKEQWRVLTKELGVDIIIQDMPLLDTTKSRDLLGNFISDIVLQLLSFVAENERNNIRIRQAEGIDAARRRGVRFGKPAIPVPENFSDLYRRWEQGTISINEFAQLCNMGRSTMYKRIGEYKRVAGTMSLTGVRKK